MIVPEDKRLVRVKPYDKRRGQLVRSYGYGGYTYKVEQGWVLVSALVAEYLATTLQTDSDPRSPCVFDIAESIEEARAIERAALEVDAPRNRPAPRLNDNEPVTIGSVLTPELAVASVEHARDAAVASVEASADPPQEVGALPSPAPAKGPPGAPQKKGPKGGKSA